MTHRSHHHHEPHNHSPGSHSDSVHEASEAVNQLTTDAFVHLAETADHLARIYHAGIIIKDLIQEPVKAMHPESEVSEDTLDFADELYDHLLTSVKAFIDSRIKESDPDASIMEVARHPEIQDRNIPGGLEVLAIMIMPAHEVDPSLSEDIDTATQIRRANRVRLSQRLLDSYMDFMRMSAGLN